MKCFDPKILAAWAAAVIPFAWAPVVVGSPIESPEAERLLESTEALAWEEVFSFSGRDDWRGEWFLDGLKAEVRSTEKGLLFVAGSVAEDDASHAVLWTQREFSGDIRIQYDYTRLDTVERAVTILYLHARGTGEGKFASDITRWNDFREIPAMRKYFRNMNALHVSYAAHFNNGESIGKQYIHARRYPTGPQRSFKETGIGDRHPVEALIKPGVNYEITVLKYGDRLVFSALPKGGSDDDRRSFIWDTSDFEPLEAGRIGLRHMWTRSARYENFRVAERRD